MQLAAAMRVSQAKARSRMHRLVKFKWQGKPLVVGLRHGNGQEAYTPTPD